VRHTGEGGFNLGIVSDMKMGEYCNLRFTPSLSFAQRNLYFTLLQNGSVTTLKKPVESTFIDFPLNVKYKSARYKDMRVYILGGLKYSLDLASNKKVKDETAIVIRLKPNNYAAELGFGFDFYLNFFKFSPEIKYSVGINNVLLKDNKIYSNSIGKLYSNVWLLSFTFE
jgi:hypothetical protein